MLSQTKYRSHVIVHVPDSAGAASCNTFVFVPHQLSLLLLATGLAFFDCLDAGYVFYFTDASVDVLQLARTL